MAELRFMVPGKPASNNRTTRNFKGRAVKSEAATLYQARVASHALVAVRTQDWRWPAACRVSIVHWNGLADWDNVPKSILDGMKGIVFPDDRRRFVRSGAVDTNADGGEEYVEVTVEPCDPLPEIVRRKCSACLEIRPGAKVKPHICGVCAQRRKRAAA